MVQMQIASLRDLRGGNDVDYPGVIQRVANTADAPLSGVPEGGAVKSIK